MDRHIHGNPRLHYRLNGCQQAKDDGLQFLSMEEKECILFFEETIDSLDEGFEDTTGLTSRRLGPVSNSASSPVRAAHVPANLMEHDIIDLVHSPTNFTAIDFQNLAVTPEHYYETIPKRDPMESDGYEENSYHPPPGSVPTPVIIASKIAEHQGTGKISASALLGRRRSLETKRDPSGPARTPRLPSKISITRGGRDPSPNSLATAAVTIQERRSQMLANMPAGSHPLEGGEPSCMRSVPLRSVSFKDMEPEKSRMEALSKLGLISSKPANSSASIVTKGGSGSTSPIHSPNKVSISPSSPIHSPTKVSISPSSPIHSPTKVSSIASSASNNAHKVSVYTSAYTSNSINTSSNVPDIIGQKKSVTRSTSNSGYEPKSEVSTSNFNYYGGKSAAITPMHKPTTSTTVIQERRSSIPPTSAEVKQTDFNSYGGKSIVLNPTTNIQANSASSSSANTSESAEIQFNSYGGRSRVIGPSLSTDVQQVNSPPSHSPTNTVTPTMYQGQPTRSKYPSEQNSYDTKPKAPTLSQPDPVYQPPVRTRSTTLAPPTASKPQGPIGSLKPRPDPVPPEILSKPAPSFRTQGITVQFSGKGTTGEARRDALRRLGLLNKTS